MELIVEIKEVVSAELLPDRIIGDGGWVLIWMLFFAFAGFIVYLVENSDDPGRTVWGGSASILISLAVVISAQMYDSKLSSENMKANAELKGRVQKILKEIDSSIVDEGYSRVVLITGDSFEEKREWLRSIIDEDNINSSPVAVYYGSEAEKMNLVAVDGELVLEEFLGD